MGCVPAPACKAAIVEANVLAPNRKKASDGICASPKHTAQNPNSDHERGEAWDLTHDPAAGCDVDALFAQIIERRDVRVKYLIRNRRICRSYDKPSIPAWTWTKYTGSNPHEKHGHVSILPDARNNTAPWFNTAPTPVPPLEDDDMPKYVYSIKGAPERGEFVTDGLTTRTLTGAALEHGRNRGWYKNAEPKEMDLDQHDWLVENTKGNNVP